MRFISICKEVEIDLVPRLIHASLLLSNSIRRDTVLCVKTKELGIIRVEGSKARRIYPDEESLRGLIRALSRGKRLYGVSVVDECCEPKTPCLSPGSHDKITVLSGDVFIVPWERPSCYTLSGLEPFEIDQRIIILHSFLDRWLK